MPDYTSILRRSISALPDASPSTREAVYQRARAALARQLTVVDPPLSTREIEAQHQQLERAVALIEGEFGGGADLDQEFAAAASTLAPRSEPSPYLRAERGDSPAAIVRNDDRDGELDIGASESDDFDHDDEPYDTDEDRSRAPFLIAIVVIALILVGGGALVYAQRDLVASLTGLPIGSAVEENAAVPALASAPAAETPAEPAPAEPEATELAAAAPAAAPPLLDDASGKRPDRLTNGETAAGAGAETSESEPAPPETVPETGVSADAEEGAEPDAETETAAVTPDAATGAPAAPAAVGQSLVAQRAIYYEQATEGAPGQAWQGTVAWSQITRPDGSAGIQAVLEMPEQNMTATISISRNLDETLPASHLVEIQFGGSGSMAKVERVPALVLKQNEQARGQPLTGAAVPVMEDLFWIALSSEEDQVQRNLNLLREGLWFDLPLVFVGGKRGLISFEKGIPGDKVFETVLASWTPT